MSAAEHCKKLLEHYEDVFGSLHARLLSLEAGDQDNPRAILEYLPTGKTRIRNLMHEAMNDLDGGSLTTNEFVLRIMKHVAEDFLVTADPLLNPEV